MSPGIIGCAYTYIQSRTELTTLSGSEEKIVDSKRFELATPGRYPPKSPFFHESGESLDKISYTIDEANWKETLGLDFPKKGTRDLNANIRDLAVNYLCS
jgi:hypothetical protein